MKGFILKNRLGLLALISSFFLLSLVLILLGQYTSISVYKFIKLEHLSFSSFILPFIYFLVFIQKNKEYYKEKTEAYFKYAFLVGLLLITIPSLNFDFLSNISALSSAIDYLKKNAGFLTILTIGFGFFSFYYNKEKIEKETEEEQNKEELAGQKRKAEFSKKFPRINKIPVLRGFVRWMYKEGWGYISIFFIIFIIGFSNIFINLTNLPLHQDEIFHFSTAYGLKETGTFVTWDYLNNIPQSAYTRNNIYTILVFISSSVMGFSVFAGRFVSAIFGVFGLFAIYYISKKMFSSKKIALISAYIYSVNDIIIYFSRFLRGYIILILLSILILYLCYNLLLNKNHLKSSVYYILGIIFSFLVALNFHATAFLLLPLILIVFLIYLFKMLPIRKYFFIYILAISITSLFILNILGVVKLIQLPFNIYNHINLNINLNNYDPSYFYNILNSYNISINLLIAMPFLLLSTLKSKNNVLKIILLNFSIFIPLIISLYFFNRYEDFRYIATIQGLFIIYLSFYIVKISYLYKWRRLILITLLMLFISFQFPYFPQINLVSKQAIANFKNIESQRIHRRTAVPESKKVFNYLINYSKAEKITILRLADGGINWDDNYYLNIYLSNSNKKVSFYIENAYYSGKFDEIFNNNKYIDLEKNIDYTSLIYNDNTYIIGNLRHLTNKKMLSILDTECKNLSPELGIIKYNYFENYKNQNNNYYPNVFKCF